MLVLIVTQRFFCIFFTDTYISFVNSVGTALVSNDDFCGTGSQISYTVPQPDGTACATYTLREGKSAVFNNIDAKSEFYHDLSK